MWNSVPAEPDTALHSDSMPERESYLIGLVRFRSEPETLQEYSQPSSMLFSHGSISRVMRSGCCAAPNASSFLGRISADRGVPRLPSGGDCRGICWVEVTRSSIARSYR